MDKLNEMNKLKIRNFGPIRDGVKNDDWIYFSKVNVFLGDQGTGKSCIAKIYTQCLWIEKNIHREVMNDDNKIKQIFLDNIETYFNLKNYMREDSYIEFKGTYISLKYENKNLIVTRHKAESNGSSKIMYMPAERNLLTAIKNARKIENLPKSLRDFRDEYLNALESKALKKIGKNIPIGDFTIEYNKDEDVVTLHNTKDNYSIDTTSASSGLQSFLPLYLVAKYLVSSLNDKTKEIHDLLNPEAFRVLRQTLFDKMSQAKTKNKDDTLNVFFEVTTKYENNRIVYVVEEPEQNLFPDSQEKVLHELIKLINTNIQSYENRNQLVIATHSPYLIGLLTLSVKANEVLNKMKSIKRSKKTDLYKIVPKDSMLEMDDVSVYYINDGSIELIPNYEGMPTDDNILNFSLRNIGRKFSQILDIEDSLE